MIELSWRVTNSRDSLRLFKYVSSRLNDAYDYGAWDLLAVFFERVKFT